MNENYIDIINSIIFSYSKNDYKGYDPYDLKGEPVFYNLQKYLGRSGYHITEILNLNFPDKLRKIFKVIPKQNPKALALFLLALCNLYEYTKDDKYLQESKKIYNILLKIKSNRYNNLCFGYPFNWYSNPNKIVKYTPNIVVSSFVGMSFLKLYEITKNQNILNNCISIANFINNDLYQYKDRRGICFSYTVLDKKRIHNANLLGGEFLSKLSKYYNKFENVIENIISFTLADINNNYSWNYTDTKQVKHTPIDNYHTAFVLISLNEINQNSISIDNDILINALHYYTNNLFENEIPILSNNQKLPINIHSCASAIIVLKKYERFIDNSSLITKILNFTFEKMYNSKKKYFYHRLNKLPEIQEYTGIKRKLYNNFIINNIDKTKYIRWNDAWMVYALSEIL